MDDACKVGHDCPRARLGRTWIIPSETKSGTWHQNKYLVCNRPNRINFASSVLALPDHLEIHCASDEAELCLLSIASACLLRTNHPPLNPAGLMHARQDPKLLMQLRVRFFDTEVSCITPLLAWSWSLPYLESTTSAAGAPKAAAPGCEYLKKDGLHSRSLHILQVCGSG